MENTAVKYEKNQVIKALKNAPLLTEGEFVDLHFCISDLKLLKGIKNLKGLWLLTSYGRDYCYSMIADIGGNEEDEDKAASAIQGIAPHDMLYKLSCEVFGEEDNWFNGTEPILQQEIMSGRIRTLYLNKEWSDVR
jgi:hypothetical protein